jgi:hypothetical protein
MITIKSFPWLHFSAAVFGFSVIASPAPSKAILVYNLFESSGNVIIQASGSLDLPSSIGTNFCFNGSSLLTESGLLDSAGGIICTGLDGVANEYPTTGPTSFEGGANLFPADSVSGITTGVFGPSFIIGPYTSLQPISSSAVFNGKTLTGLGFTSPSGTLLAEWILDDTGDKIQLILGAPNPNPSEVPGPLPLLGAAAAFGMSRKLRYRLQQNPRARA